MRHLCLLNKLFFIALTAIMLPHAVLAQKFNPLANDMEAQAIIAARENSQNNTVTRQVGYDSQGGQVAVTNGRIEQNTSISSTKKGAITSGDDGNCEPNETNRKKIATEAYTNAYNAYLKQDEIHKLIDQQYVASNGDCHFLYGTSSKWWDEAWRKKLRYTASDVAGAKWVDKYDPRKTTCSELVQRMNDDNNYSDWDFKTMLTRATGASAQFTEIYNWAASAKEGDTMSIDDDTSSYICSKVKCKKDTISTNDCNMIIKQKGSSFSCVDRGVGSSSRSSAKPDKNGKCYGQQVVGAGGPSGGTTVIVEIPCEGSAADNDIAYTFSSVSDFKQKVPTEKNSTADKCIEHLNKLVTLRGNESTTGSLIDYRNRAHKGLTILSGAEDMTCYCKRDADGNLTNELDRCEIIDDPWVVDNFEDDCKTIPGYKAELEKFCIVCGLFAKLMKATQDISTAAFDALSDDLVKLLTIAYLIFLGYTTLLAVASPETQKIGKYLTSITIQGFKVAVAVLILQSPKFLYQEAINPILESSVDFSLALNSSDGSINKVTVKGAAASYSFSNEKYLSSNVAELMTGMTAQFSKEASTLPAIGRAFICWSYHHLGLARLYFIPRVAMFVQGVILTLFGLGIMLAIGFYLLDAVVRLAIVCALMAFFVACWPFKLTAGYTKIGWNMFLNIFFQFIIMGIIILTINVLVTGALGYYGSDALESMLNEDKVEALNKSLDLVGLQIVMLVVCCFLAYKLTGESNRLANKFAAGAKVKMGAELGGLAASAVKSVALGSGKVGLKALKSYASSVGEHSGAKGALQQKFAGAGRKAGGAVGIGANAKMGSKGRDADANSAGDKPANFKPSNQGDES